MRESGNFSTASTVKPGQVAPEMLHETRVSTWEFLLGLYAVLAWQSGILITSKHASYTTLSAATCLEPVHSAACACDSALILSPVPPGNLPGKFPVEKSDGIISGLPRNILRRLNQTNLTFVICGLPFLSTDCRTFLGVGERIKCLSRLRVGLVVKSGALAEKPL